MRRTVIAVAGIAVAAIALAGCNKTSYQCDNGSCDISVRGTARVDLGRPSSSPGSADHDSPTGFEITGYEGDAVAISSFGDHATVKAGESRRIGRLTFQVNSVKGESAKMHVEG